jgi:hypothetical protein
MNRPRLNDHRHDGPAAWSGTCAASWYQRSRAVSGNTGRFSDVSIDGGLAEEELLESASAILSQ